MAPTQLPPEADRVLIAVNPRAGRRSLADQVSHLAELLRQDRLEVQVHQDLEEVTACANRYQQEGSLRALIGVGGDGTAAELTQRTLPGVPLSLFPAGTSNLLARQYRLPRQPEALRQAIRRGHVAQLDAGRANGRLFLLMVGCGFDGEVVQQLHDWRQTLPTGHINYLSYAKPIFRTLRTYRYPPIHVAWDGFGSGGGDGGEQEGGQAGLYVRWAFVFNLPQYGWGLPLAPAALATDGQLDLCAFGGTAWWDGLRYVAACYLGRHQRLADCQVRRSGRFRLTSPEPVRYQVDGDPGGHLPLEVEVLPGRLSLVLPIGGFPVKGRGTERA